MYRFDGRPIDRADRENAMRGLSAPSTKELPGLLFVWNGPAGLADTPVSFCTLDGRVDWQVPDRAGAFAARLYHSGIPRLAGLIGDWSLALWDAHRREIVLASDYAGARPLYYFRSPECIAWSSSLGHLAGWMNCRRLDPDYVAAFLENGFPQRQSPYRGIQPVPPGSAVSLSNRRAAVTTFWQPPLDDSTRYRDDREYEEQYRTLFQEAVAVRLQGGAPVAAELSGGLDSSSIVCMADRLIASGAVPAPGLVTFSYFIPDSPDHRYMEIVERACSTAAQVHLDAGQYPVLTPDSRGTALPIWAEARLAALRRHMEERGLDVLLTGQLGDLINGNDIEDSGQAADYFRHGEIAAGVREAMAWSRSLGGPVYSILWRALHGAAGIGEWSAAAPSRQKRLRGLAGLTQSRFFQCPEPLDGMLYTHPFTHRPLVEFLLSVPAGVLCRPGEPRRLMRRALRGIVPEAVLRRRSKGNYEALFLQSLRPCAAALVESGLGLRLAEMGFVERQKTADWLRKASLGLPLAAKAQLVIRLEHWLRQGIRRGAIAFGDQEIPELGIWGSPDRGLCEAGSRIRFQTDVEQAHTI